MNSSSSFINEKFINDQQNMLSSTEIIDEWNLSLKNERWNSTIQTSMNASALTFSYQLIFNYFIHRWKAWLTNCMDWCTVYLKFSLFSLPRKSSDDIIIWFLICLLYQTREWLGVIITKIRISFSQIYCVDKCQCWQTI